MSIKLYIYIFVWGFLLGLVLIRSLKKYSTKNKFLNSKGIALIGGIAIALSFIFSSIVAFSIWGGFSNKVIGIILASFLMMFFGIIDDWKELSIFWKFMVQVISAALLIIFGIKTDIVYIGKVANIIVTLVWVIGITNAFNHLDIIDGLAGGIGLTVSLSFFIIALLNTDLTVAIFSLVLSATICSFLVFNLPPAKVYMGNTGSHFLGFSLAALALLISYASLERKIALFSPLLILGFPIYDTTFLILMRLKQKRSIFKKSSDHLAHRFLRTGCTLRRTLIYLFSLGLFFSISGLLVSQLSNKLGIFIIVLNLLLMLFIGRKMNKVANA